MCPPPHQDSVADGPVPLTQSTWRMFAVFMSIVLFYFFYESLCNNAKDTQIATANTSVYPIEQKDNKHIHEGVI